MVWALLTLLLAATAVLVDSQGSPGDKCAVCEYVMESVDRTVK